MKIGKMQIPYEIVLGQLDQILGKEINEGTHSERKGVNVSRVPSSISSRGLRELPPDKHGRRRWEVTWWHQGRPTRRRFTNKALAQKCLDAVRGQIAEGRYLDRKKEVKTTFEEACRRFKEWSEVNLRPSTSSQDGYIVKRWQACPYFAGKTLDQISPSDIEAYKTQRLAGTVDHRAVSQRMVDYDLSRLRRLFSLCEKWEISKKNPVKSVEFFNPDCRRERFLTDEEEERIFQCAAPKIRPAIVFALNTGLRRMEQLTLTWKDVDLKRGKHGQICVTAEKAKGKRSRYVPLNAKARAALDSLPRGLKGNSLVFAMFGATYNSCLREAWQKALKASKVEDVVWHTLRHTYASRLVMAGVNIATVQKLLGHTSINTTMRYAHLAPGYLEDAVLALDTYRIKTEDGASRGSGG